MTDTEARDEILAVLATAWAASGTTSSIPLSYVGDGASVPTDNDTTPAWARADVREVLSRDASLTGANGTKRYENRGLVVLQIFTPTGDGHATADAIKNVFKEAFRGTKTANGVWFRNVRVTPVGTSGAWYQHNGIAEYSYDEVM